MSISSVNPAAASPAATFAESPSRIAQLPADQQVKAAAGQFEAILLRQFLQESVSKLMNPSGSDAGGGVYSYMLTDVLAGKLAAGGGLGMSEVLVTQLSPRQPTTGEGEA